MAKFRKKPVVIEAFQFTNSDQTIEMPVWLVQARVDKVLVEMEGRTFIKTLEGALHVSDGDWIIQGVKGELYPCKPYIFAATYEPA